MLYTFILFVNLQFHNYKKNYIENIKNYYAKWQRKNIFFTIKKEKEGELKFVLVLTNKSGSYLSYNLPSMFENQIKIYIFMSFKNK